MLRARYRAARGGPHVIGAGGVGQLTLAVDGTLVAAGAPRRARRPGGGHGPARARSGPRSSWPRARRPRSPISLLPEDWPQGPVAIRLGIVPAPDADALLREAVEAAARGRRGRRRGGLGPGTESEGFDRPGLALPGGQDELVRRVAEVNDRTIVVVNAGMPVLMPWADQVAAIGYCWLPGQAIGDALADVLLGRAEPGGRLPVTIPAAEADCPVLHAVPGRAGSSTPKGCWSATAATTGPGSRRASPSATAWATRAGSTCRLRRRAEPPARTAT